MSPATARRPSRAGKLLASPPTKPAPTPSINPPPKSLRRGTGRKQEKESKEEEVEEEEDEEEEEEEEEEEGEEVEEGEKGEEGGEDEEGDEGEREGGVDLESMTVAELKQMCKDAGIEKKGHAKKAELICALEELMAPVDEEGGDEEEDENDDDDEEDVAGGEEEEEEDNVEAEEEEEEEVVMKQPPSRSRSAGAPPHPSAVAAKPKASKPSKESDSEGDSDDEVGSKQRPKLSDASAMAAIAGCSLFGGVDGSDEESDDGDEKKTSRGGSDKLKSLIRASVEEVMTKKLPKGVKVLSSGLDGVGKIGALQEKSILNPLEKRDIKGAVDKLMSKSTISTLEKHSLTLDRPGLKPKKKTAVELKSQRWFGMKSSELDLNAKYTLQLLANRDAIDPKRHYRKESRKPGQVPSLFQIGTVVNSATDYYSSRLTKKQRKPNLAEEVLADDRLRPYIKGKFDKLQAVSEANGKNALKKMGGKRKAPWKQGGGGGGGKKQKKGKHSM